MRIRNLSPRAMSFPTTRTSICDVDGGADTGGAGGAGAGGADGGAGGGGAGGGDAGGAAGGGQAAAYYESFQNADLKTHPSIHNFKTAEDLANGYVNLEKRFGIDPARRIDLPADPNDEAGMRAVFEKLGAPKDAAGYGFKLEDGASDFDKGLMDRFSASAHKHGLSVAQARGAMDFLLQEVAADQQRQADDLKTRVAEGETALKSELGAAYEPRLREVEKLVEKYGDADLLAAIKGDGLKANPNLTRMFVKMLDRMAEPGAMGGQGGDSDTGSRAMTPSQAQAAVSRLESDPVKGVALRDASHAQHKAVVAERNELLKMAEARA